MHDPKLGNGKSQNLNNALKQIYGKYAASDISTREFVAVLDADMVPVPECFMRMLPHLMDDDKVAIVQSPQHFWNIDYESDILENGATLKWHIAYKGVPDQVCVCVWVVAGYASYTTSPWRSWTASCASAPTTSYALAPWPRLGGGRHGP